MFGSINPGEIFGLFLSFVPDTGSIDGKGGLLFMKPKANCKGFDVHNPKEKILYQPNQSVGVNTISKMLPTLCDAVGEARATNHMLRYCWMNIYPKASLLRATAIKYMRRSGLDWLTISKIKEMHW